MKYKRMPIEMESPEELGYSNILNNLAESSVRDRKMSDIQADFQDLVLNYGDHRGLPELRKHICFGFESLQINDVLVCQAAAMALFIVNTSLLSSKDHLIVIRPNYATNIETPKAIGSEISFIDLLFENAFQLDIEDIKRKIKPNTRLISITSPHNPSGVVYDENILKSLVQLAEENDFYLLVDETYRELNFRTEIKPYLAEMSEKVISISSLSKAYGFPGLRMGWIVCKNAALQTLFLAAKEQIIICNSVVDEYLAYEILKQKNKFLLVSHKVLAQNFEITKKWIEKQPYLEWVEPKAGTVCFIRFKKEVKIDFTTFYQMLFKNYKTMVGPGHWFEQSDQYFRLGFGYPSVEELLAGLQAIDSCLSEILE